jgi:dTDP-4-dehydrorhamnose 3,5-epimerase
MDELNVSGCFLTALKIIPKKGGNIFHALKSSEKSFSGFCEVYLSTIEKGISSDWKLHKRMTLNLIVPSGKIEFILHDQREVSSTFGNFSKVILGRNNYRRLTIPPNVWVTFRGISRSENILVNVANLEHDPNEVMRAPLKAFEFKIGEV